MKVKRYIATDVSEAMIKVKNELGRDAVILHTRKIKKPGIMGFLKKPLVEVIAAVDSSYSSNSNKVFKDNTLNSNILFKNDSENIQNIHSQIDSIKSMLNTVLNKNEKILLENNIAKPIVDKILTIVSRQISISDENEQSLKNAIKVIVKDYLGKPYSIENAADKPKVIFFVGPTGVGKTTTLAKLGAKLSVMNNKSVAFITSDTYRIAAVDQLKTYSEILSVPLTVIYEPHEIREAITKYNDKDYILVDTAGRNHKDKELLTELFDFLY
jgi:flagellar biosynthesis protein FlhF